MVTYFHGAPEIQTDGLQTLYLMNPGFEATPANMVYLNSSMNPMGPPENPQSTNPPHLAGIPLQPTQDSDDPRSVHTSHQISAAQYLSPRIHYNPIDMSSLWRPIAASPPQQRLSLSLSPHQAPYRTDQRDVISPANDREVKVLGFSSSATVINDGISGLSTLMGSKYLKAAQQLLDEVVSLWRGTKAVASKHPVKSNKESEAATEADTSMKRGADLSTAEKQELQMKKAKLANMLDEVEQRYRQYRQQMQMVITSFESVAGFGSARTYTAIALQTISKQFRCLRDAISGQIRATSKSLGEEEGDTKSSGSRLRFVDHHLRQQRALQQLGMIQHSAWRPQRGLPERAVSVLRAWLFEHFLHPYPKDSDKHMLAKQTGLTRSQVSNWFINARVRLWKPMVEEMYMEESKDQGQTNDNETTSNIDAKEDSVSKSSANQDMIPSITEQTDSFDPNQNPPNEPKAPPIMIEDHSAIAQSSFKKARSDEMSNRELLMEFMNGGSSESPEYHPLISSNTNRGGGFGTYSLGEIGRFDGDQFMPRFSGNGVSLTLGLPHSENLTLSGTQPSYLSSDRIHRDPNDYSSFSNNRTASHPPNLYEGISIQNRKRFSGQLLPDYVA